MTLHARTAFERQVPALGLVHGLRLPVFCFAGEVENEGVPTVRDVECAVHVRVTGQIRLHELNVNDQRKRTW
jgi:hypothetical protein